MLAYNTTTTDIYLSLMFAGLDTLVCTMCKTWDILLVADIIQAKSKY